MQRLLHILAAITVIIPVVAQPQKHPMLTIHRQRVVQSCGAMLDATSTANGFQLSSIVGLTTIGTAASDMQAKAYLGFWVPIPVILDVEDDDTDVVAGDRIWSWPNPFRDHVSIDVEIPDRSIAEASIFNSIGKHVATLTITSRHRDGVTFTWDGSTDDGNAGANGSYLVRVFVQEPMHQRRIVYSSTITRAR